MKNISVFIKHIPIFIGLMITGTGSLLAVDQGESLSIYKHPVRKALNSAFPTTTALDQPGYVLRVMRSGRVLYEVAVGGADIEQMKPITSHTVFHIASLSKQITAAALAHAIQDGLVSLEDSVDKWIPEVRKYGEELTIAHLVYMTSGLTEYTELQRPDGRPWATFHYFDNSDAIKASLSIDSLRFAPGEVWEYSNINYMVLAQIVEKAYDKSFSDVVREKIFMPLKMSVSLINDDITAVIPNRANAYLPRTNAVLTELSQGADVMAKGDGDLIMIRRNSPHYGGSGVMTSMADWSKWQNELLTEETFGAAFWSLMKSRREFAHGKHNDAFGLVHGKYRGLATLWYSGGDIDTSTYSLAFVNEATFIACFSNNPLDSCEQKAVKAAGILKEYHVL